MFLVVLMHGTTWTEQRLVVLSAHTTQHSLCKSRSEVQMNRPQRFIGVAIVANSGMISRVWNALIFECRTIFGLYNNRKILYLHLLCEVLHDLTGSIENLRAT